MFPNFALFFFHMNDVNLNQINFFFALFKILWAAFVSQHKIFYAVPLIVSILPSFSGEIFFADWNILFVSHRRQPSSESNEWIENKVRWWTEFKINVNNFDKPLLSTWVTRALNFKDGINCDDVKELYHRSMLFEQRLKTSGLNFISTFAFLFIYPCKMFPVCFHITKFIAKSTNRPKRRQISFIFHPLVNFLFYSFIYSVD